MKNKTEELVIPDKISVFEDKRTSARTIALPFQLPDGSNAIIMVSRLSRSPWKPEEHIKSITINYVDPTTR